AVRKYDKRFDDPHLPNRRQNLLVFLRCLDDGLQLFSRQDIAERNNHAIGIEADSDLFRHRQAFSVIWMRSARQAGNASRPSARSSVRKFSSWNIFLSADTTNSR